MDNIRTPRPRQTRAATAVMLGVALAFSAVAAATPAVARTTAESAGVGDGQHSKVTRDVFFHSPSKNIYCVIFRFHGRATGRCDIMQRSWPAPHKPHSCHLDYGNGAEVGPHGKGHFTCAGDTVIGQGHRVLRYGHSIKLGAIKCTSRRTGMTCQSVKTDHGFTISREAVDFF
jgi:hypothetical protein